MSITAAQRARVLTRLGGAEALGPRVTAAQLVAYELTSILRKHAPALYARDAAPLPPSFRVLEKCLREILMFPPAHANTVAAAPIASAKSPPPPPPPPPPPYCGWLPVPPLIELIALYAVGVPTTRSWHEILVSASAGCIVFGGPQPAHAAIASGDPDAATLAAASSNPTGELYAFVSETSFGAGLHVVTTSASHRIPDDAPNGTGSRVCTIMLRPLVRRQTLATAEEDDKSAAARKPHDARSSTAHTLTGNWHRLAILPSAASDISVFGMCAHPRQRHVLFVTRRCVASNGDVFADIARVEVSSSGVAALTLLAGAGGGEAGPDGTAIPRVTNAARGMDARFRKPVGIDISSDGSFLVVCDYECIRRVELLGVGGTRAGRVSTIAASVQIGSAITFDRSGLSGVDAAVYTTSYYPADLVRCDTASGEFTELRCPLVGPLAATGKVTPINAVRSFASLHGWLLTTTHYGMYLTDAATGVSFQTMYDAFDDRHARVELAIAEADRLAPCDSTILRGVSLTVDPVSGNDRMYYYDYVSNTAVNCNQPHRLVCVSGSVVASIVEPANTAFAELRAASACDFRPAQMNAAYEAAEAKVREKAAPPWTLASTTAAAADPNAPPAPDAPPLTLPAPAAAAAAAVAIDPPSEPPRLVHTSSAPP